MRLHHTSIGFILVGMLVVAGCQRSERDSHSEPSSATTAQAPAVETQTLAGQGGLDAARFQRQADEFLAPVLPARPPQEMTLVAMPVTEAPSIDGQATESFWATAPAITTHDYSSQRPITLKSVYTTDMVFFLVTYPDESPSETHKTWVWDPKEEIYREGPDREDVFIFKWSMVGNAVNLALREPEPHRADIWFWKAHRTNPAGYADDKWQGMLFEAGTSARKIHSPQHGTLYFWRQGDTGEPAFAEKFFFEYQGDMLEKYTHREPESSRGDVRAKGVWAEGQWTIEFGRQLNTGHDDDVVFTPGSAHLFGVSCYAMALDTPHDAWAQPLYRTGDVFDRLFFTMAPRDSQ